MKTFVADSVVPIPSVHQDQHLDRLGGILRSLRAPPSDRAIPPTAVRRSTPARYAQQQEEEQRVWQQQQQQQEQEQHDERPCASSGFSSSPRLRTPSHSSTTEAATTMPLLRPRSHEMVHKVDMLTVVRASWVWATSLSPVFFSLNTQLLGDSRLGIRTRTHVLVEGFLPPPRQPLLRTPPHWWIGQRISASYKIKTQACLHDIWRSH